MLDIYKLPAKYQFNEDTIKRGNYIDDGSLLVYYKLTQGWFSGKDTVMSFIWGRPVEWDTKDLVSYLIKVSKEYDLKIENINVMWGGIEDDFEKVLFDEKNNVLPEHKEEFLVYLKKKEIYDKWVNEGKIDKNDIGIWFEKVQKYNPKHFKGSYKWALDQLENNPKSDFSKVFGKLKTGEANADDIEKVLVYANRIAPKEINKEDKEGFEASSSKEIMGCVLEYMSFSIVMTENDREKIKKDIFEYLNLFIKNGLKRGSERIQIQDTRVSYPSNILNFNAHREVFSDYLKEMLTKYGNNFRIINKFEEGFSYDNKEVEPQEIKDRYNKKDFLFVHCVLAFNQLGLIKIRGVSMNWDALNAKPVAYESQVEILPSFLGQQIPDSLHFDADKSRLYIDGKEVKITKFKDEYHTLRVIFENPDEVSKEWFFSEINEKNDAYSRSDDKKYYNAIYQTKNKLKSLGLDDVFITTKQSVKINPKYLS